MSTRNIIIKFAESSSDAGIAIRKIIGTMPYRASLKDLFPVNFEESTSFETYKTRALKNVNKSIYTSNKNALDNHLMVIYNNFIENIRKNNPEDATMIFLRENHNAVIDKNTENDLYIIDVQEKLESLKYLQPGYQRGVYDQSTENAVKAFQKKMNGIANLTDHKLKETGTVDFGTYTYMGRTDAAASPAVPQAPRSSETNKDTTTYSENKRPEKKKPTTQGRGSLENLSNVRLKGGKTTSGLTDDAKEFLYIINNIAKEEGRELIVTSLYRSPKQQSGAMYVNYKKRVTQNRGVADYSGANQYLARLYRRANGIKHIIKIFSSDMGDSQKIDQASKIIASRWGNFGHLGGTSIDVVPHDMHTRRIINKAGEFAELSVLNERDHFHISVKSIYPEKSSLLNA